MALLQRVARRPLGDGDAWAAAMLRELDFIESDWAALFWAIGSTTAIFRRWIPRALSTRFARLLGQEDGAISQSFGRKTAGIAVGVGMAIGVIAIALGLVSLLLYLFPKWDAYAFPWVGVIIVPEIVFIFAVIAVWSKRRFVAVGILLSAVTLATHFLIHIAGNFR
jgi:hypothetical protein